MCMHVSIINFQNFSLESCQYLLSNSLISCLERKINNLYAPRSLFVTFNLPPLLCQITKTIKKLKKWKEREENNYRHQQQSLTEFHDFTEF